MVGCVPQQRVTTILGSCVAVCLHDPIARIGGMNHILLPEDTGGAASGASFGVNAMELLINGIIKHGGARGRLVAKVFGGGRMVAGLSDVGALNSQFVRTFLEAENIACIGESTGGTKGRRIEFWPYSGKARQKRMARVIDPMWRAPPRTTEVELF